MCIGKIWLFDFCEVLARVSGKRQCAKCGSVKILFFNVRWAKNKKHWVGLSVGFLVLSVFCFSVLSQCFTFCFGTVVWFFTLGGNASLSKNHSKLAKIVNYLDFWTKIKSFKGIKVLLYFLS
jgi:nitrate reductase NapE component